jgi:S-adenosylmethionine-dependent methyltransferase
MAERWRRKSVSQTFLLDLLDAELDRLALGDTRPLDVVDVGGGTGGVAMALAAKGHHVTVIDPSPDALASLERRTADAGQAARIRGVQGDAADLAEIAGPHSADVVVCHRVLEVVDSPAEALVAMAGVLRPGGVLSLLVSQRHALVLTQALGGHIGLARRTWADSTRFDERRVVELVEQARFTVLAMHGVGAIADHVPESLIEADPENSVELLALEAEISQDPAFRALAPQLHVFAQVRSR